MIEQIFMFLMFTKTSVIIIAFGVLRREIGFNSDKKY